MKQQYYDFIQDYDRYYFKRRAAEIEPILAKLGKDINILDGGCGFGNFIGFLESKGFKEIYGLDINKALIQYAQNNHPSSKISFGDITNTKFPDGMFDIIMLMDVIEHLDDYGAVFRESRRILKPGGLLIITYPNPYLVPLFNFLGNIGLRVYAKDNKIYLKDLLGKVSGFRVKCIYTRMLISKMPKPILSLFEHVESFLGQKLMRTIGFFHFIVLERT